MSDSGRNLAVDPALSGTYAKTGAVVDRPVAPVFVDHYTGTDPERLAAACAAASSVGGLVELPDRALNVGAGFSMSGYSCGIRGRVAGASGMGTGTKNRSVIYANTQAGPVLDFTGFQWPGSYRTAIEFSDFLLRGNNVADPTKANVGLSLGTTAGPGQAVWRNLAIFQTGGACIKGTNIFLHSFENVRCAVPTGASTNDVPFVHLIASNGNNLDLTLYAPSATAKCGISGAVVIEGSGTAATRNNVNVRAQGVEVPSGGTLVSVAGNANTVRLHAWDYGGSVKDGAGSSMVRLRSSGTSDNYGGNEVIGWIPGADYVDTGVDILQNGNRVVGVKGYGANNVTLRAGVNYTYACLQGAYNGGGLPASGASAPGFTDSSGTATNALLDFAAYPKLGRAAAANPGTATGTDAAVINSIVTALRNQGIVT